MKKTIPLISVLFFLSLISISYGNQQFATVIFKSVQLLSLPSFNSQVVATVLKGEKLSIKGIDGEWLFVEKTVGYGVTYKGWVAKKWLSPIPNTDKIPVIPSVTTLGDKPPDLQKQKEIKNALESLDKKAKIGRVVTEKATLFDVPTWRQTYQYSVDKGDFLILGETDESFLYVVKVSDKKCQGWIKKDAVSIVGRIEAMKLTECEIKSAQNRIKEYDIKNKNRIKYLEDIVRPIPASNWKANLEIYQKLLSLDPENEQYANKVVFYKNYIETEKKRKAEEKRVADQKRKAEERKMAVQKNKEQKEIEAIKSTQGYQLRLVDWSWGSTSLDRYVTAKGEIKNITGYKLKNIVVLVTWYDENGKMITYDQSLIEYNPLMPGQTSPFSAMERFNPLMESATIVFKTFSGGSISFYKD